MEKSLFNRLNQLFTDQKDLFTKVNAFASSGLDKLEMTTNYEKTICYIIILDSNPVGGT